MIFTMIHHQLSFFHIISQEKSGGKLLSVSVVKPGAMRTGGRVAKCVKKGLLQKMSFAAVPFQLF
jgi:hypothetical protein